MPDNGSTTQFCKANMSMFGLFKKDLSRFPLGKLSILSVNALSMSTAASRLMTQHAEERSRMTYGYLLSEGLVFAVSAVGFRTVHHYKFPEDANLANFISLIQRDFTEIHSLTDRTTPVEFLESHREALRWATTEHFVMRVLYNLGKDYLASGVSEFDFQAACKELGTPVSITKSAGVGLAHVVFAAKALKALSGTVGNDLGRRRAVTSVTTDFRFSWVDQVDKFLK